MIKIVYVTDYEMFNRKNLYSWVVCLPDVREILGHEVDALINCIKNNISDTFYYGTENIIYAIRVAIMRGLISHESIKLFYNDTHIPVDSQGKPSGLTWPTNVVEEMLDELV